MTSERIRPSFHYEMPVRKGGFLPDTWWSVPLFTLSTIIGLTLFIKILLSIKWN